VFANACTVLVKAFPGFRQELNPGYMLNPGYVLSARGLRPSRE
jgi:hypothetical protein